MKITGGDGHVSVFMGKSNRTDAWEDQEKNQQGQKKGGSIFAGNMNQQGDMITARKRQLLKNALKAVNDQFGVDSEIDMDIEERRRIMDDCQERMKQDHAIITELDQEKEKIREEYGVAADSQEQQDLELIEKAQEAKKNGNLSDLSKEELDRLSQMGPLTDYQRTALAYNDLQNLYRDDLASAQEEMLMQDRIVRSTQQGLLGRKVDMTDAAKASKEMQKQASKEIAGMLIMEAKNKMDEEFAKLQEEAKKEAEKKEEEEELLEEAEKRKLEAKVREEKAKEQIQEMEDRLKESTDHPIEFEQTTEVISQELQDIVDKQKMLEEDIKGLMVDSLL